ncbi:MAG: LysM peptidoglycan-binding domain-containing protein [Prevotellaceae bacterium]|jgi:LysM repeat protein|nr:LysM peptidoglycan-binding domain-containing protein [Prevotellaceae bacterium]
MRLFCNCLYITLFILLCGKVSPAQTLPNSGGYKSGSLFYYFHVIRKDETLSQIAKTYNLSVNEILEVNTTIADPEKIVEGMKIKVPNYSHFIDKYPHEQWNFILYKVKQGDKLKSIAKEFKTNVDDVKNVNPGIENKPVMGAEIRVPVKKQNVAVQQQQKPDAKNDKKEREKDDKKDRDKDDKKEREKQPVRNPALTFNWGDDDSDKPKPEREETVIRGNADCAEYIYQSGTTFTISLVMPLKKDDGTLDLSGTSFLGGALIAVNEMKNKGLAIKLNSFDVGRSNSVDRILRSSELRESNVIIAQTPVNDLAKLAAYAYENRIHLVVPYENAAHSFVVNNPYVVQLHPSDNAVFQKLINKQYNEDVFPILVKPDKPDSLMLDKYRAALKKRFGKFVEQTHKMARRDLEYKDILDVNKLNLIFVCPAAESSKNQPFVSDLIDRLNLVKHRLSVYGRDEWQSFGLIEKSLYFNTNVHLAQPVFVDYNNEAAKLFVQLYRKAYNSEPEKYAFLGYDATYYFLSVLRKYGADFQNCVSGFDSVLLQSRYKLVRNNINDGFVNEGCFLLEYTRDSIEIKRE